MRFFDTMEDDLKFQIKKFTIIFVIAATVFYTVFRLSGIPSEVGTLYYRYAESMLDLQMPYSDFGAEYPPFAMVLILIPGLFSFSSFSYQIAFGLEVYVFLLIGLICVHRIAGTYSREPKRYSDLYIILSLCLFDFVMDRYDIFPTVMCLTALYFIRFDRIGLAWVMIALGAVTKLYPALMGPVLLIYLFMNGKVRSALNGIAICLVIGILSILPFIVTDLESAMMFLTYHMDRGMQVEALASSFIMLFGHLGLFDIGYIFSFGSDNIYGSVPDAVAGFMMPLMLIALLSTYVLYWYVLRSRADAVSYQAFVATCLAAIMSFMLANKVLSSQYLVWMIPFLTVMIMRLEPEMRNRAMLLFGISIALTQINLIVNYVFRAVGEPFSLSGICVLMVRNIALVLLFVLVIRTVSAPGDPVPNHEV